MASDGIPHGIVYVPFTAPACWAFRCNDGKRHVVAAESLRREIESGRLDLTALIESETNNNVER